MERLWIGELVDRRKFSLNLFKQENFRHVLGYGREGGVIWFLKV